jgi:HEAT repeat protein
VNLEEYKTWFKDIITGKKNNEMEFVWSIMKSPYTAYHYDLLLHKDNINKDFFRSLRSRFDEHGEEGKEFLLAKLDNNEDEHFHGEIIFMLGLFRRKYPDQRIQAYARKLITSENDYTRNRAVIVLGWVGDENDLKILDSVLSNESNNETRGWSATSMMQMYFRLPQIKDKALEVLQKYLENENDNFVLDCILVSIQVLLNKKKQWRLKDTGWPAKDNKKEQLEKVRLKAAKSLNEYFDNL